MRTLAFLAALGLLTAAGCDKSADTGQSGGGASGGTAPKRLAVGDPAPPWTVSHWLNGDPAEKAEPGKVYVLEFWAVWCGPCHQVMPHLSELQAKYRDQGLVVIGMTSPDDQGNTLPRVTQFVNLQGGKLGYVIGFDQTGTTQREYMMAARQRGIPCSFVIGRDGKVKYIGHPNLLDDVLPKVLADNWQGQADLDAINRMYTELDRIFTTRGLPPEQALADLDAFAKQHPDKARDATVRAGRMSLLVAAGKWDEAREWGQSLLKTAEGERKLEPALAVMALGDGRVNPDKKHLDLAVQAADLVVRLADQDADLLLGAASVYAAAGNKERATAVGRKAVDAAPDERTKKAIFKTVDSLTTGK